MKRYMALFQIVKWGNFGNRGGDDVVKNGSNKLYQNEREGMEKDVTVKRSKYAYFSEVNHNCSNLAINLNEKLFAVGVTFYLCLFQADLSLFQFTKDIKLIAIKNGENEICQPTTRRVCVLLCTVTSSG